MSKDGENGLDALWSSHAARWRDPADALAVWDGAGQDDAVLTYRASGEWWEVIDRLKITVLLTREYEHLMMAASVFDGRPRLTYLPLPHPSGLAVNREAQRVVVASTRNPN